MAIIIIIQKSDQVGNHFIAINRKFIAWERTDQEAGRDEIWNNYREKSWRVKLSPFLFRWPKFKKWKFENIESWERKLERERESLNFLHLLPFTYLCNNFVPLLASWNDSNATICSLNYHGHHPCHRDPLVLTSGKCIFILVHILVCVQIPIKN